MDLIFQNLNINARQISRYSGHSASQVTVLVDSTVQVPCTLNSKPKDRLTGRNAGHVISFVYKTPSKIIVGQAITSSKLPIVKLNSNNYFT